MAFNPTTGMWEDDDHPDGGSLGEQAAAPIAPMPPPAAQAPGPELAPSPNPPPQDDVMPPSPGMLPTPPPGAPLAPSVAPVPLPPPLPAVPPSRVVSPAEAQTFGAEDANTAAQMKTAAQQGQITTAAAQTKASAADDAAAAAQRFDAERQQIADDAQKQIAARQQQATADYQQYKNFGIKDPDADKSFGRRILEAIAIGFGQYGASMNGGPNNALNIIQSATKENIDRQKAQQEKLLAQAERSGKDVDQAKKDRDDAFRQLDLKHSALLDSSAAMLRSQLAKLGVPQAQIDANEDVQKVEAEALKIRENAFKGIRDDETSLARADIAAAARRKGRGTGGGGSTDALAQFAERAGQLKPGDPIPSDLVKLGRQAGLKPNQIAAEADRYRGSGAKAATGDAKAANAGMPGDRLLSKEATQWAQQNGLTDITKKQREIGSIQKILADAPHNPEAQALAVEKAVSAARGGAASKQALALAMEHLGGSFDNAAAFAARVRSGELGEKQMENFRGFLNAQLGAAQGEGKNAYDSFNKYIESTPDPGTKARLLQERSRLFSGMHGFGGETGGGGGQADPRAELARKALADPNASPAVKARALQIIRGQ